MQQYIEADEFNFVYHQIPNICYSRGTLAEVEVEDGQYIKLEDTTIYRHASPLILKLKIHSQLLT